MATNLLLLHLTLLLFFLTIPSHDVAAAADKNTNKGPALIRYVCQDTNYRALCVSSLKSNPQSYKVYFKDLGPIVVDVVLKSAIDTRSLIDNLLGKRLNPGERSSLESCRKNYDLAVYNLKLAVQYFKSGGFSKTYEFEPVEGWVRTSQSYFTNCGAALKKQRGASSSLRKKNEDSRRLADNAFVIIGDLMV